MAAVMKNVSVTEMLADNDAIFIVKRPVSSASAVNSSQTNACGIRNSAGSDHTIARAPIAMTDRDVNRKHRRRNMRHVAGASGAGGGRRRIGISGDRDP